MVLPASPLYNVPPPPPSVPPPLPLWLPPPPPAALPATAAPATPPGLRNSLRSAKLLTALGRSGSSRIFVQGGSASGRGGADGVGAAAGAGAAGAAAGGSLVRVRSVLVVPRARPGFVALSEAVLTTFLVVSLIMFGFSVWFLASTHASEVVFAWALAGLFASAAVALATHTIHLHLRHYVSPLQRHYVRIVALIIIYAVESWLALRFPSAREYAEAARDMYEAFALYSFYRLMLEFLGGPRVLAARLVATGRRRSRCVPCYFCCWVRGGCCRPWKMGQRFVHRVEVGIYQYVVVKVVFSILIFIAVALGLNDGYSPLHFNIYETVFVNISQSYALTTLAVLYLNTHDWIADLQPLYKFGTIKLLIFVLFWQKVLIGVLGRFDVVEAFWTYPDKASAAAGILDFAICVELLFFAIAMLLFFSYADFWTPPGGTVPPLARIRESQAAFLASEAESRAAAATARAAAAAASGSSKSMHAAALDLPPPVPLSVSAAAYAVMPTDILMETARHARTCCGARTKRIKRAIAPRAPHPHDAHERRRPFPCCCILNDDPEEVPAAHA